MRKISQEEFLKLAEETHKDKYLYSKTVFVNYFTKIIVTCPKHGDFETFPSNFIKKGCGCPQCAGNKRLMLETFIVRARETHGNKYDYSKVVYVNNSTKVAIVCHEKDIFGNEHGVFYQKPSDHIGKRKNGCPKCAGKQHTTEEIVEKFKKVHGNQYCYNKTEYRKTHDKLIVTCPKHGDFEITYFDHLRGRGCPICKNSTMESEVKLFLENKGIKFEQQKTFEWLKSVKPLHLDFYLPDSNIAIECQGRQHFEIVNDFGGVDSFKDIQKRDEVKFQLCKEHGIKLLYYSKLAQYHKFCGEKIYHTCDELPLTSIFNIE